MATVKRKAESMTCKEAVKLHPGTTELKLARMCLKGQRLLKLHGSDIPEADFKNVLFGKKVGKYWYIPVDELHRVFLPDNSESLKG